MVLYVGVTLVVCCPELNEVKIKENNKMIKINFFKNDATGYEIMACHDVPKVSDIMIVQDASNNSGIRYRVTSVMQYLNYVNSKEAAYCVEGVPIDELEDKGLTTNEEV